MFITGFSKGNFIQKWGGKKASKSKSFFQIFFSSFELWILTVVQNTLVVLRTEMKRWICSPQVLCPNTVVVLKSREEWAEADHLEIGTLLGAGEKMALPDSGTQKALPEHHHYRQKAEPQRDVGRKIKEISQCLSTAPKAPEAHQQDKDAPGCRELPQIHSQFRWGSSPHPFAGRYKSSHTKNQTEKEKKPMGLNAALVWALIWQKVIYWCPQWVFPSPGRWNGDCSLCARFAPWASAVRALGLLQPRETLCPCIHNLGTIRNTNWPSDPLLIYSNFCVKHLIPLLWLLAPNITSYMGLVSSKYHHV